MAGDEGESWQQREAARLERIRHLRGLAGETSLRTPRLQPPYESLNLDFYLFLYTFV
ncbi:MAG: hypothetical protein LQ348_001004 [Seirophora lacunosa]|nr:MAG: hypothetical protein LQ348_001004 [Seirophora lacunosa]